MDTKAKLWKIENHNHTECEVKGSEETSLHSQEPKPHSGKELEHHLENKLGDSHMNILPMRKLLICLFSMALCNFASFCDQTGVTVALPQIAKDLHAENTINWAGTSALLANCVCQVPFGRLSDIFGRKNVLLFSLCTLTISNLLCGFAQTGPQFYVFRAFAGIGLGGCSSLLMVILSDVVTLKQRGRFQGILGSFVGIGNAFGPLIMAAFAQHSTWRNFYRMMPPILALVTVNVYFFVDSKKTALVLSTKEKLKKIDYLGMFFSTATLVFLLIPISGGGSTYKWTSALIIAMFVVGGLCFFTLLLVEWKIPELPMIPLSIFKNRLLSFLFVLTFCFGAQYFGFLFIVSYYFQLIKGESEIRSAYLLMPLVLFQAAMSVVAGNIITSSGHFYHVTIAGFCFWLTGCGMTLAWKESTLTAMIVGTLVVMGTGVGFIFQPTMVAAQANARKAQRAVVISTRNVLRSFGGALGIAVSTLIISNTVLQQVTAQLSENNVPKQFLEEMKQHIYSKPDISGLSTSLQAVVRSMYMKALRNVFYFDIALIAVGLLLSFFVRDNGLKCIDDEPEQTLKSQV